MKKLKSTTKGLMATLFLIGIIAVFTPVMACANLNRVYFMAIGEDLDFPTTRNLIVGSIKLNEDGEPSPAGVLFHSKIYDESGKKVYTMIGMLNGYLINTSFYFYCPLMEVYWINVWHVVGEGKFRTTDTEIDVSFRNLFTITMPNTEGKFVSAPMMLMFLSPTGEFCLNDPKLYEPGSETNPIDTWPGGWVLPAVICEVQTEYGPMVLPIGPISNLTRYIEF